MTHLTIRGILAAAFALVVWGVTFANTRALLVDSSALEIMVVRFALAWVVLIGAAARPESAPYRYDAACAGRKPYRWER